MFFGRRLALTVSAFLTAHLAFHPVANAISLEDALALQTHTEIKPVQFEGLSFPGIDGPISATNVAARVCMALGYVRLVKFTTEPCTAGEKFGIFLTPSGSTSQFSKLVQTCREGGLRDRMASVVCAK